MTFFMAARVEEKHSKSPDSPSTTPEVEVDIPSKAEASVNDSANASPTNTTTSTDHLAQADSQADREEGGLDLERVDTPRGIPVKVPQSERRGLFARFTIVSEITEPYDYSDNLKWFITFTVAFAAAAAPFGSGVLFPSLHQVEHDLNTTPTTTNLSVALFMLSMAIFPLWWSAFSEASGRRTVYLISFALFMLFSALAAVSKSIAMLIVMRMLSGGASASVQAVGAGTIADIWQPRQRGRAMGVFYLGPLCGPLLSPIIGGALAQKWNWRATMWCLVIYGFITWIFVFFALPETLRIHKVVTNVARSEDTKANANPQRPALVRTSTREQLQTRTKNYVRMIRMLFIDPLKIVLYLRFPPVLLTVYYASVTFGSLYVLNVSIQYTFEKAPYAFSTVILGLLYIPNSLGYIVASIFGGRWMDKIMKREALKANRVDENGKLIYQPEDRMRENAWLGALLYPAALLWYGWTAEKGVFFIVPMIANFFYGIGSMLIFAMATTMLTEFMPKKSSSGVAVNNLVRNIFSCVGAIVGAPLIDSIGNGWLFTILGLWALSTSFVIWAMKRFGPRWRVSMEARLA